MSLNNKGCGCAFILVAVLGLLFMGLVGGVAYWVVGPSIRCQLPNDGFIGNEWSAHTVVSDGDERCYYLYVPPTLDSSQAAPLVVSMHGFLMNPDSQVELTGWHELAGREGFIVAYPQGTDFPQRWNAGKEWGTGDVDDVALFHDVVKDVSQQVDVDPTRVYVNGFSNGGGMSVRIACELADEVAAVGAVAGAVVSLDDCRPSRPVPLIAFHGNADPIVNYYGFGIQQDLLRSGAELTDAPIHFLAAQNWVAQWAMLDGCASSPETISMKGDVRKEYYTDCQDDVQVILYTIDGGGHTWPGGTPIPGLGKTSGDIDATEEMWRFFQTYHLDTP